MSVVEPPALMATEPFIMMPPNYFTDIDKALRETAIGALKRAEAKLSEGGKEGISF
jgi:hypothetical protein